MSGGVGGKEWMTMTMTDGECLWMWEVMDHDERMNVRVTLEGRVWMRAVTGGMAS